MPVANVIRVSLLGVNPNGEVWSVNPVWQIGGVSTSEDVSQADVTAMATAIAAIVVPTGLLSAWATSTQQTGVRVEARRWDGTLAALAEQGRGTFASGSGGSSHTFQTAIVSSLRTAGVGGSSRGRLYWPATGIPVVASTLRPAFATVTSVLSGVKTYLTSITAAISPSLTNAPVLSVWSRTNAATLPVNSIIMGDILDIQRRRRDALTELNQSLAFP